MFADAFWPNFAVFVLGQGIACAYLATGRLARGACLMLGVLVLFDVALVARFGYGAEHVVVTSLVLAQAYVLVETGFFAFGRWHRQRPDVLGRRRDEYRAALVAELRGDDDAAAEILQRLRRRDPWDIEATVALATVQRRRGDPRRAAALLRRARRLDRRGRWTDVIVLETARLSVGRAEPTRGAAAERTAELGVRAGEMV